MRTIKEINKWVGAALALGVLGMTTQASAADSVYAGGLIVNEWNAVAENNYLDDCSYPSGDYDPVFHCDQGNGDNWIELVVTEFLPDIEGWTVYWENEDSSADDGAFTFTDTNPATDIWKDLEPGTIITVRRGDTDYGGADDCSGGHRTNDCYDPCNGDWWIRVDLDGPFIEDEVSGNHAFKVDNDCWSSKIEDDGADLVQHWVGEHGEVGDDNECINANDTTWSGSNISGKEVGKLEANPIGGDVDIDVAYNDGDCSSFGQENCWNNGTQNFSSLRSGLSCQ